MLDRNRKKARMEKEEEEAGGSGRSSDLARRNLRDLRSLSIERGVEGSLSACNPVNQSEAGVRSIEH